MKTTKEHIDTLRRLKPVLANTFEALSNFMDDQTTFESLVNAHREAEQRLVEKRQEEKGIDTRLENAKTVEKTAESKHNEALNTADDILAEARLEAGKIKQAAEKEVEKIIAQAKLEGGKLLDGERKKLSDLEAQTTKKRNEFTELADAVDEKAAELSQHKTDLEAAKAHIAKLLKG